MPRNTYQKLTVLKVLNSLRGQHPTVETVYEQVAEEIPFISKATVYRILNQASEQGTVKKLHVPESADRYDDLTIMHHHLMCTACHKVVDLAAPYQETIRLPQDDETGCQITGVQVMFTGLCSDCVGKP